MYLRIQTNWGKIIPMKILALSDQIVERIYSLAASGHFNGVDLILGCGDLPYTYLEYLMTVLKKPLAYVPGNHDPKHGEDPRSRAEGGTNLDVKSANMRGLLIAGLGGSIRYRPDGVNQYTQRESYARAARLLPTLLVNKFRYGRRLDILISHSPPFGIHDETTQAHTGLRAINWLLKVAKPRYHFHGHTHFYRNNLEKSETVFEGTTIINVYPYKIIEIKNE
jgi:Icc-related predicted phosphoesterase